MKVFLILILVLGSFTLLNAQEQTNYASIGRTMSRIPDTMTYSTDDIAGYINTNFTTQKEKARAAFIWITRNIKYNFDSILTNSIYETPAEVSERILKTRTGVCLNFAYLFNEIANKTGIKASVIQGYTKQNGRVDYLPHLWCAAFVDTAWFLIDPTWGSAYFMTKPAILIRSHMPFDPVWQLLYHPITHEEFYKNDFRSAKKRPFFNFPDTLSVYQCASELDRAIASARRIEQSGVKNAFTEAKVRVLKGNVDFLRNKQAAEKYETAVNNYNAGISRLNLFISHRNNRFEPRMDSLQLIQILDSTERFFTNALTTLSDIKAPDENINLSVDQLKNAIRETVMALNDQRAFLHSYLKTRR